MTFEGHSKREWAGYTLAGLSFVGMVLALSDWAFNTSLIADISSEIGIVMPYPITPAILAARFCIFALGAGAGVYMGHDGTTARRRRNRHKK
jgi:hypothetical protein